jgi:hypothetical protein
MGWMALILGRNETAANSTMKEEVLCPDYLSHYYECARGPFLNLSDLPCDDAERLMAKIRQVDNVFASKRGSDYLEIRRNLEETVRKLFIKKGGKPHRKSPHYMILGSCPWLKAWYLDGRELRVPLSHFHRTIVSFTYGDTFPAMRFQDGQPYRGQVYTLEELPEIIHQYGLPQEWNPDGKQGPDRYIEAQIWANEPIKKFLPADFYDRE